MYNQLIHDQNYKFNKEIKDYREYREHFIFDFDKAIENKEAKKFEERVQDVESHANEDNEKLCILKVVLDKCLQSIGEIHIDVTKPFDINQIVKRCHVDTFDRSKIRLFYEPCSILTID
jgi:hypothetical protein